MQEYALSLMHDGPKKHKLMCHVKHHAKAIDYFMGD